jgi:hypothetical protein
LHIKDHDLLKLIQLYFKGIGSISLNGKTKVQFRVTSMKDLEFVIDHFNKFPLITQKYSDFKLFEMAFLAMKMKKHFTLDGLTYIASLKAVMNLGLSDVLKFS